jgi:hypothetical protein
LASSNNAAVPTSASCTAGSSSGSMQSVCDVLCVYEPGQIGAVVAQAWPGRQRGHQPTSILVAGALTVGRLPWQFAQCSHCRGSAGSNVKLWQDSSA